MNGVIETEIALAVCYDCEYVFGPDHASVVGNACEELHRGHETDFLGVWREVEVVDEERLFDGR